MIGVMGMLMTIFDNVDDVDDRDGYRDYYDGDVLCRGPLSSVVVGGGWGLLLLLVVAIISIIPSPITARPDGDYGEGDEVSETLGLKYSRLWC